MRNRMLAKFSYRFLFLAAGLLVVWGSSVCKAQSNSKGECGWVDLNDGGMEYEYFYNPRTGQMDSQLVYKPKFKRVWLCAPTQNRTNPTISGTVGVDMGFGDVLKTYPHTYLDEDGDLTPVQGYVWIDPENPNDFRVRLVTGLIRTKSGELSLAKGYEWANNDPDDLRVRRIGGKVDFSFIYDALPKRKP